ncbi:MAG: peptide chain release factor N(5)-glutamine methyltransferase [Thermovirgaceae bacterium]|nr:peptide chain release factor N(5)-glutamine methyltransferase [Thermovirgaceae bacterium]
MDLKDARSLAAREIGAAGIERPWYEADLIISSLTGYDRSRLHADPHKTLSDEMVPIFLEAISRRAEREPLQYILGNCRFMDLTLAVGPGCLIPRPETELLVIESRKHFRRGVFLDWGTGSGCLAAAILQDNPESRCIAVEKEPKAIMWAWKNLKNSVLLGRCLLWHSGDPGRVPVPGPGLEMIVANPPYIPSGEIPGLMPEVSMFEPSSALDGGLDGLDFYRLLVPWSAEVLRPGGVLILEIGDDGQAREIETICSRVFSVESLVRDLQGISRILVLKKHGF